MIPILKKKYLDKILKSLKKNKEEKTEIKYTTLSNTSKNTYDLTNILEKKKENKK